MNTFYFAIIDEEINERQEVKGSILPQGSGNMDPYINKLCNYDGVSQGFPTFLTRDPHV